MKGKMTAIFLCAAVVLLSGTAIAYYNTKSFGFDENAKIISKDDEKLSFLDFDIYYKDVDSFFVNAGKYLPERPGII